MGITKSRIEYINSANRTNGTNEDFYITLTPWSREDDYDYAVILYANIPVTYYMVVAGQNTFTLVESGSNITVTIPSGNYSVQSFARVLGTTLTAASTHGWTYTASFPNNASASQTGLYTYNVTGNTGQPSFVFTSNLFELMGFNSNSTNTFVGSTLTSVNVVDFVPENTLYLYSDVIETKDNNTENIMQEFYASNIAPYSNIVYQCTAVEAYAKKINKGNSNYLHFTLLNENYQNISLNGQPMFLTLLLYKKDNIIDILKKLILKWLL